MQGRPDISASSAKLKWYGLRTWYTPGRASGLTMERSAQLGSLMATLTLETVGTQEYDLDHLTARVRLADCYGDEAATEIVHALGWAVA